MSSNVYTLPELVDLALQTPEVGVVNFNILRKILHRILTECQLQNATDKWESSYTEQSDSGGKSSLSKKFLIPGKMIATKEISESEIGDIYTAKVRSEDLLPSISDKPGESHATYGSKDSSVTTAEKQDIEVTKGSPVTTEEKKDIDVTKDTPETAEEKQDIEVTKGSPVTTEGKKYIEITKDSPVKTEEKKDIEVSKGSPVTIEERKYMEVTKDASVTTEGKKDIEVSKRPVIKGLSETEVADVESSKVALESLLTSISEKTSEDRAISERQETKHTHVAKESITKSYFESQDADMEPTKMMLEDFLTSILREPDEPLMIQDSKDIKVTQKPVTEDIRESQGAAGIEDAKRVCQQKGTGREAFGKVEPKLYKSHYAAEDWDYIKLSHQVEGLHKGFETLSHVMDLLLERIKKLEGKRRKGGVSAPLDLEDIDDRLSELEEAMAQFAADHKLLMEMNDRLNALLKEFEALKALAELLEKMQIDISKKADKEETMAALDLKADVELVNSKVDRFEFETAIEELGEAIGLLGLKFIRKNDEWEERAAEIWAAIDSKMTFDVFEAARIRIESRLTALMYGLRMLKKVVEDLLYPESSGVTRCILCRRPACISGLECMEKIKIIDRPESRLSAGSSGDAQDGQSSVEDKRFTDSSQISLQPASSDRTNEIVSKIKSKKSKPYEFLDFTKTMLAKVKRGDTPTWNEKFIVIPQMEQSLKATSVISSQSSVSKSSVDLTPDPTETVDQFAPVKSMPDVLRRDVLLSPAAPKDDKPNITSSTLHSDK